MNTDRIYKKDLEGLAKYATNLYMEVFPQLEFQNTTYTRKILTVNTKYTGTIKEIYMKCIPEISAYYDDKSCIIKIFMPSTVLIIKDKVGISIPINEAFIDLEISKKQLTQMSLDFKEVKEMIDQKLIEHYDNIFFNLRSGMISEDNEISISAKYLNCNMKYVYTRS